MRNIFILALLFSGSTLLAQEVGAVCGAERSPEQIAWLKHYQQHPELYPSLRSSEVSYVPVQAHIVGTDEGLGYYKLDFLFTAICELNERFDSVGMYFVLTDSINYINNSSYYEHDFATGQTMMYIHNVDDVFNMYFVNEIGNTGGGTYVAGYYSYGPDAICMRNGSSSPGGTTITHEVGHYMSMPHTFSGWEYGTPPLSQQEKVDGSNCTTAGDGFCDTPPDYAPYPWFCPSIGPFYDPDSVEFYVTDTYYMSYAQGTCKEKFSGEQSEAMLAYLLSNRSNLLISVDPYEGSGDTAVLSSPEDGAIFIDPDNALLQWEAVPEATAYHVTIGYNRIFSAIAQEAMVSDTSYLATGLTPLRNLYWKVKPIFPGNTCAAYSETYQFETGERLNTGISPQESSGAFKVFPNPWKGGNLQMLFESEQAGTGHWLIRDVGGRIMAQNDVSVQSGSNTFSINSRAMPPGLYFLEFRLGDQQFRSKFIALQ